MYHYTYQLTDQTGRAYIGARSCHVYPTDDVDYMSSSKYVYQAISNGFVFEKKILAIWPTRLDAVEHEIKLHDKFDVAKNLNFYNKSKQTNSKFDTTGAIVSEETRKKISEIAKRPRSKNRNYVCKLKGRKQSESQIANRAKAQTGKFGMLNNKGAKPVFAINLLTKEACILIGRKNIVDAGFDPSTVHKVCHKKTSSFTHKNHVFRFLAKDEIEDFVLDLKG